MEKVRDQGECGQGIWQSKLLDEVRLVRLDYHMCGRRLGFLDRLCSVYDISLSCLVWFVFLVFCQ